jgi:hypothetical protein
MGPRNSKGLMFSAEADPCVGLGRLSIVTEMLSTNLSASVQWPEIDFESSGPGPGKENICPQLKDEEFQWNALSAFALTQPRKGEIEFKAKRMERMDPKRLTLSQESWMDIVLN